MVRLEHCDVEVDWFALDNRGVSVEGTYDEWTEILDSMERREERAFRRVMVQRGDGRFLFSSPRNSVQQFEASAKDDHAQVFIERARAVLADWKTIQAVPVVLTGVPGETPPRDTIGPAAVLEPSKPRAEEPPRRRDDRNRWDVAEVMVSSARYVVEAMGAHAHLARAIEHLNRAQSAVADFLDKAPSADDKGFSEGAPLDLRTLQRMSEARVPAFKKALTDWSPMEWGCELGEEVGEYLRDVLQMGASLSKVLGAVKKRSRVPHPTLEGHDITGKPVPSITALGSELADVVIVASLLASRVGVDLNNAVRCKWNETSEKIGWKERL